MGITGDSNTVTHNSNSYGEAYGDIDVDGDDNSVNPRDLWILQQP